MKNLVIFFEGNYLKEYGNNAFFCIPDFTKQCFLEFMKLFNNDKSINIFICRGGISHCEKNIFKYGFLYKKNSDEFELCEKKINADFIFNRSSYFFENSFNNNQLIDFCKDKTQIINTLNDFCPQSTLIHNENELIENIDKIEKNEKVVLKSVRGSCGNDILISREKSKLKKFNIFPCLLQEFLDTSEGIPGICESKHDLRVIILNGEVVYSLYRVPAKNSDISNLSKGGTLYPLEIEKIPKEIFFLVEKVEKLVDIFSPRLYSLDIGFSQNGIKIFELNSSPALYTKQLAAEKMHKKIYTMIKNNIQ